MSRKDEDSGWLVALALFLLAALAWATYRASAYLVDALLRRRIEKRFDGVKLSLKWQKWEWLFLVSRWACFCCLAIVAVIACGVFVEAQKHTLIAKVFWSIGLFLAWFALVVVSQFTFWVQRNFEAPDMQRRLAGLNAEKVVAGVIETLLKPMTRGEAVHNALLVFNSGSLDEYSIELDHVLATDKNVYVFETKYKTGDIYAHQAADEWVISTKHGDVTMRSPLKQAKNAVRVLRNQLNIDSQVNLVPVVVFVGKDTKIFDGPSNVVSIDQLPHFVDSLETETQSNPMINKAELIKRIRDLSDWGGEAYKSHIQRAELTASRRSKRLVVENLSVD
jgi:hypothetical protein